MPRVARPGHQAIFDIMCKYFRKDTISKTTSNGLDALALNETIYTHELRTVSVKSHQEPFIESIRLVSDLIKHKALFINYDIYRYAVRKAFMYQTARSETIVDMIAKAARRELVIKL